MDRMRRIRARISSHDSAKRFRDLGVDVFLGEGRFTGKDTMDVGGRALRFKKAVIATGARPRRPTIEGIEEAGYLTNETVFNLTDRPQRIAVLGGGPIGCELAQVLCRLGSEVFLIHKHGHILDREDGDAAKIVQDVFLREGIGLFLDAEVTSVVKRSGEKVLSVRHGEAESEIAVNEIVIGAGRLPNVSGLGLETAGVAFDERGGVKVDDGLRTSNRNIYAAGDVSMHLKFTHAADAAARIVIQNALFLGRKRLSALTVPWCTYTDPEIAHVGMYEKEAAEAGIEIDTFIQPLEDVDRAVADSEEEGFVKVHVKRGTDRIVGATIVARHGGDMISELTLAMVGGLGLSAISGVIHPYPTQAEAIKRVGDAYNRTRLTPGIKKWFSRWFRWNRRG
jgi:pyruvate/2-oxoglutarate dehydrogenase complex dihydrolipoamide dehydrogenase (E3) component